MSWRNILYGIIACPLFLCSIIASHAASEKANSFDSELQGRARFVGRVILPGCRLAMKEPDQLISLNRESGQLKKIVQLKLNDCDMPAAESSLYTARQVRLNFDGIKGTSADTFLMVPGVDLQIKDRQGNILKPGDEIAPVWLNNKTDALDYELRLVPQNVYAKNRDYSSVVRFNIYYE